MTFVSDSGTGNPVFDYSSRDYTSVYADLVNRIPVYLPEWTSTSASDFGQVLLQMFAYVADLLGYYEDRIAGEAFIQTATQAVSILNLAAMLDYQPTLSDGAQVTLNIAINPTVVGPITIPAGSAFSTVASTTTPAIIFLTTASLTIAGSNGATPATTGSVAAVQGQQITSEAVATANGVVNQTYPFQQSPVSANSFSVFVDLGFGATEWTYVQTLINSGPYDQVYTTTVDANGVFYIIFGDGVNGYVPTLGSPITATYQINVGANGNVGAGTITVPVQAILGLSQVTNPLSASGGAGAESLASIQVNAPASLKALNRAVTVEDMQTLAIQVPGVQWASAIEQTYQLVNLYIAPFGGGAPSALLDTQVESYVSPLSMANTTITIYPPTYVPVNVTAQVVVFSQYSDSATQTSIVAALANLLSLTNTGFGFRVPLGLIYTTILDVVGVNYAIVSSLTRQMTAELTSALAVTPTTFLGVTPLPEAINVGDSITINPGPATPLQITGVTNVGTSVTAVVNSVPTNLVVGQLLTFAGITGFTTNNPNGNFVITAYTSNSVTYTATLAPTGIYSSGGTISALSQTVTASTTNPVGATGVGVNSFTPSVAYPVGTPIQDTTGTNDAVMLANEIPVAGTLSITVSGGLA